MDYECFGVGEVAGDTINFAYVSGPFSRGKPLIRKRVEADMLIL